METKYKNCKKCKLPKEISENNFYRHPTGKDGFKCICKNCTSLKTYGKTYVVPLHDLSRWIKLLEITSTQDGMIAFSDWFS